MARSALLRTRRRLLRRAMALAGAGLLVGCGILPTASPTPPKIARIGYLSGGAPSPDPFFDAFREGLSQLGYVEGQNVQIEAVYAEGKLERLPELAAELVR